MTAADLSRPASVHSGHESVAIAMDPDQLKPLLAKLRLQRNDDADDAKVVRNAVRLFVALCRYAEQGYRIDLMARWDVDAETTREVTATLDRETWSMSHWKPGAFKPSASKPFSTMPMDPESVRLLQATMESGRFSSVGCVVAAAVMVFEGISEFHARHRNHDCWLSIDGCGRRRWYWPFGRPGRRVGNHAGMPLDKLLIPRR